MTEIASSPCVKHTYNMEAIKDCYFKDKSIGYPCPQTEFSWTEECQKFVLEGECTWSTLILKQANIGYDITEIVGFFPHYYCSEVQPSNHTQRVWNDVLGYFMNLMRNQAVREGWSLENSTRIPAVKKFFLHRMKDCFDQSIPTPEDCSTIDIERYGQALLWKGYGLRAFLNWTNTFWEGGSQYDHFDYVVGIKGLFNLDYYKDSGQVNFDKLFDIAEDVVEKATIMDDISIGVSSLAFGMLSLGALATCIGSVCGICYLTSFQGLDSILNIFKKKDPSYEEIN